MEKIIDNVTYEQVFNGLEERVVAASACQGCVADFDKILCDKLSDECLGTNMFKIWKLKTE